MISFNIEKDNYSQNGEIYFDMKDFKIVKKEEIIKRNHFQKKKKLNDIKKKGRRFS